MGTWGSGNFDSDSAGDFLGNFIQELVEKVDTAFNDALSITDGGKFLDDFGEYRIMPLIDIVITLCTTYEIDIYVGTARAMSWKSKYLQMYDNAPYFYAKKEFTVERRKVISDTFDRLIASLIDQ